MKRALIQEGGEWNGWEGEFLFDWIYYSELGCFSKCCITWELI